MTIHHSKLSPLFKPSSLKAKQDKDALKDWKAFFYTLQNYAWKEACRNLIEDGRQSGFLVWSEEKETYLTTEDLYAPNGELLLPKGSESKDWFNVEKPTFLKQFDEAYCHATQKELAEEIFRCYGLTEEQVRKENAARMAQFRKRDERV